MNSHKVADNAEVKGGRRRRMLVIAAAAGIGMLALGGTAAGSMNKDVTLVVDGQERQVSTMSGSVGGALSSAGIDLSERDVVAPSVDSPIEDGSKIVYDPAKLMTLTINGETKEVWTTADTVEDALVQLGQDPAAFQLSADRSREIPLDGMALTADAQRTVGLAVGGAPAADVKSGAATVADLLADQGITLAPSDRVIPEPTAPVTDGLQVVVDRVQMTTVTETLPVFAPEQRTDDPNMDNGATVVTAEGTAGEEQVTTEVTSINGTEVERKEVSRVMVTEPVAAQVTVGTKSSLEWRGDRVFFNDTEFGVNWDGLAYCEATNRPTAVYTPVGYPTTYGLFQFDQPTWESVDGAGSPLNASPEEQLKRAKMLFQKRGLEPWLCAPAASAPPAG